MSNVDVSGNFKVFQSGNIHHGFYDSSTRTLTLVFGNGTEYRYRGVPPSRWEELKSAVSPTRYLREQIEPNYSWKRIPKGEHYD